MSPQENDSAKVDAYIEKQATWCSQLTLLRNILLETQMQETVKWGGPTYTLNGKLLIGIAGFKQHYALWFHQGVFLKDQAGKLSNAQEGKTKAMRQWRFTSDDKIDSKLVKAYVLEAIANSKAGKEVKHRKREGLTIPPELAQVLAQDAKLKAAFDNFTEGKQREFTDHIANAKQQKTKITRLEKMTPLILSGTGLLDKYRNC